MPRRVIRFYQKAGWVQELIYDEAEMALALNITVSKLRKAISDGHLSHGDRFGRHEFPHDIYKENIKIWQDLRM